MACTSSAMVHVELLAQMCSKKSRCLLALSMFVMISRREDHYFASSYTYQSFPWTGTVSCTKIVAEGSWEVFRFFMHDTDGIDYLNTHWIPSMLCSYMTFLLFSLIFSSALWLSQKRLGSNEELHSMPGLDSLKSYCKSAIITETS